MTLCGACCVAGRRRRHNVKPRTPRIAPFPATQGSFGCCHRSLVHFRLVGSGRLVAPTSKWASVPLRRAMTPTWKSALQRAGNPEDPLSSRDGAGARSWRGRRRRGARRWLRYCDGRVGRGRGCGGGRRPLSRKRRRSLTGGACLFRCFRNPRRDVRRRKTRSDDLIGNGFQRSGNPHREADGDRGTFRSFAVDVEAGWWKACTTRA